MSKVNLYRIPKIFYSKLSELEKGGFDSFHLPGGTSKDGKHSSFVIAWYYDEITKDKYLLVLPYRSTFHQFENIEISKQKETPEVTAIREFYEEVGLKIKKQDLYFFDKISKPSNEIAGETHTKYFYIYKNNLDISQLSAEFSEKSGEVSSPFFLKKSFIKKHLFQGHYYSLKKILAVKKIS
ncbi:MAG: NUDIX domain-containing protein [Candidatus Nomurabacteria bacterium]